ncbi:preprotein translocase subunit SecG [Brevundimonas sp.]|uniref:preprotein translocase subunit SecG n=1 Tax=Brevundimonas sp. TaxID=1871086 RepID=UPI003BA8833F
MLQTILLVAIIIVAVALTGVVLLQRSEGGALGMGGGPAGFMTARGAGNLLTQITWILAALLFGLTIFLTVVGNMDRASVSGIDADAVGSLATTPQNPGSAANPRSSSPPPRRSRRRRRWTIWKPAFRRRAPGRRRPQPQPSSPPNKGRKPDQSFGKRAAGRAFFF